MFTVVGEFRPRGSGGESHSPIISENRAFETALIFAEAIGFIPEKIMTDKALYESSNLEDFFNLIRRITPQISSVILFGHNPTFSHFASKLSSSFTQEMPKASIAGFEFKVDNWMKIKEGQGSIILFKYPV